jgi:hypothetical protein
MATAAQTIANQANALHSTGPKTPEGKDRASRNNTRHGLTLGVLLIEDHEKEAHAALAAELREQVCPGSNLEEEAFRQLLDGTWRLQKVQALIAGLFTQYNGDPLVHPEAAAQLTTLGRYRAAAEMLLYRGVKALRELQTVRLYRQAHLATEEMPHVPPSVIPGTTIFLLGHHLRIADRDFIYQRDGGESFTSRYSDSAIEELREHAEYARRVNRHPEPGDTSPTC